MQSEPTRIVLKSGKDQSLRRFHPWVFSGAIKKIHGPAREGDLVEVFDNKDEFLGLGHYQEGSIAVRILSFERVEVEGDFWKDRIGDAWELRRMLGLGENGHTSVFRWINAEGDRLPGLIADYYAGTVVVQVHSAGMYRNLDAIAGALKITAGGRISTIYNKSESTLPDRPGIDRRSGFLEGKLTGGEVTENGYRFLVDWKEGQKTGFYIDQRENRELVSRWSAGRKVLNMFGYTGGFSIYALGGGAVRVDTVDSSVKAIELTGRHVEMNFPGEKRHHAFAEDAFEFLRNIQDPYELVILDPPAFAKHQNVLANALQGYKRLNQAAFEKIAPGGILFTFSCSQAVSRENFRKSVFAAAANARRSVRILYQLSQPPDHPVSIFHPEGEYLKGLVLEVS
ncbi:MAG: class I SAM-dependent rRNA methyltransferase [Bacteroidetes bacterium]|nr:MAG: class I SAM-dependent rRNA methyltransferase [Bacteroidota bacterium]